MSEVNVIEACGLPSTSRKLTESIQGNQRVTAWISHEADDPAWDRFLQSTSLGQFQQSTIWARAKGAEGWQPVRVLVLSETTVVAGFQIMARPAWRGHGRIGYVSKGPVVLPGPYWAADFTVNLFEQVLREERLTALIVQPPDLCSQMSAVLRARGFLPDFLAKVNDTTWIIDLGREFELIEASMGRTTRNLVRRAAKTGITVRPGGREDIPRFFELMLGTCRRQQTNPNPSELRHFEALWDAAAPTGNIQLFLAEQEGKVLAGLLAILFGETATLWKVGAAPPDKEIKPNDSLYYHAIRWIHEKGYRRCDFAAFDRRMALSIQAGEPLSDEHLRSRFLFLTRFGGSPRLVPGALIGFPNPLARSLYRLRFRRQLKDLALRSEGDPLRCAAEGN